MNFLLPMPASQLTSSLPFLFLLVSFLSFLPLDTPSFYYSSSGYHEYSHVRISTQSHISDSRSCKYTNIFFVLFIPRLFSIRIYEKSIPRNSTEKTINKCIWLESLTCIFFFLNKHTYSWKARLLMNKQAHIEMSTVISVEGSWELEW